MATAPAAPTTRAIGTTAPSRPWPTDDTVGSITITRAKALLRQFDGSAWTNHIERDGGVFETTEIKLKGNNSRHKYNRHL